MNRNRWIRGIASACLLALPVLMTGCSLFQGNDSAKQIDPPPAGVENQYMNNEAAMASVTNADQTKQMQATLYFKDPKGFVAPITMDLPQTAQIAKEALEYMVDGGPGQSLLPEGFTALLPKGTKVRGINVDQKLATVDLSGEFAHYDAKDERKIVEAVTWTMTGFNSIDKVRLRVNGKDLKEMPVNGFPLDEPLSRSMGINIEGSASVNLGQSTPVTLYFLNRNDKQFQYFVPVTRLISYSDDIAKATLQELIKGPEQRSNLTQVMPSSVKILSVNNSDGLVTVNFSGEILGQNQTVPAEALQSVVLSLTENTGDPKVQIMVDNSVKVNSSDNGNYSLPVTRPAHLNPYMM
ncbi:GerMN domain-containing protein [Ferviditalea candida]|uniref:GerMN domain-containing protein n=1 Tax=Ferviditalea candida TaxID=3108399 RepID=A0ABU5ZGI5_9BACL|nr:GerMN domain-containing protein [Paenibacillaceae bacterium T2]